MYVLGVSCFYHDASAALMKDGVILAAAEEERFTRVKHDARFPLHAIEYCLEAAGIGPDQLDHVAFYEKPLLKFERILSSYVDRAPASRTAFVHAMRVWLNEKLFTRQTIRRHLPGGALSFGEHHLSHAASAFLVSPFDEAAVLTADGVGEWATTTTGIGHGSSLELLREIRFPHSLGLFYSAFTAYLGFEVNEGEYKVMGMAAYGRPRYADLVRRLLDVASDGSYQLDMRYFTHDRRLQAYGPLLVDLLGPPRRPDADLDQRHADIAASVQLVVEEVMVRMATDLRRVSGMHRLAMAGGVALNGLANARVLREAGFDEIFIQPAAGDAGGSIGAAAYLYHTVLGGERRAGLRDAFLGPPVTDADAERFLSGNGIPSTPLPTPVLIERVADLLAAGKVVGWCRGRMEFGPRALGARSILASPRDEAMKEVVNEKIKHREAFRPFAPSVPVEDASRFFELDRPSPYMLLIVPVRAERRAEIPAVTHVDGTARVQTVSREIDPDYHELLRQFGRRTGVPVLLNTSFNVRGEPIVNTAADAFRCFSATDIDHLVLGDRLIGAEAKRALAVTPSRVPAPIRGPDVIV